LDNLKEQDMQIQSLSRSVERLKVEIDNLFLEKETEIKSLRVDRMFKYRLLVRYWKNSKRREMP